MKVVAFAGSNSQNSINKALVSYVLTHFEGQEIDFLDLNDYDIPLYSIDREKKEEIPQEVHQFIEKLGDADLIITSLAEHNGTYTAVFKNLLDWSSRINLKFFADTPLLLLSTSPGGYGGGNVMEAAKKRFPKFGANIKATFSLPNFKDNFDTVTGITNSDLKNELLNKINQVKKDIGM